MEAYDKNECIGHGQFSRVFSGIHISSKTRVALKLVPKPPASQTSSPDFVSLATLKDEVKCQRALRHPNILRLLACFDTVTDVVFVSELCSGDLLQSLKKKGKFSESEVFVVAKELVSGLQYLHERDMKLQNVLVGLDGKHKICDFGFTKRLEESDITMQSVKGTPVYMSPEMIKEEPYTYRVDLWALAIDCQLYNGLPPFYTTNIFNLVNLILNEKIKWPASISPDFKDFLSGLLDKNPATRLCWPFILKHPYIQAGVDAIDVFDELHGTMKSPTRIDSAVEVAHLTEPKAPQKILSRSASMKDLILRDTTDWTTIKIKLMADNSSLFADQSMLGVLVSKIIAIGTSDEYFELVVECTCLLTCSFTTQHQNSPLTEAVLIKTLKQICTWFFTLAKSSFSTDDITLHVFRASFDQFIVYLSSLVAQSSNTSCSLVDWIPTSYAQVILPTVSRYFKEQTSTLQAIHLFRLYVSLVSGFRQSDLAVYVRDIVDLELIEDMFRSALNESSSECLTKLFELIAITVKISAKYPTSLEYIEKQLVAGSESMIASKSEQIISIALKCDRALAVTLELILRSDIYLIALSSHKLFLQNLFSVSASDQLDISLRAKAITTICHTYQVHTISDGDTEWLRTRMESLMSSLDPAATSAIRTSPSKASFVFKSFSSSIQENSNVLSDSLVMLRFLLGKEGETCEVGSTLTLLQHIRGSSESAIEQRTTFYEQSIYTESKRMAIRMIAMHGVNQVFLRSPKLILESSTSLHLDALANMFAAPFDTNIIKLTFAAFIRRFSGAVSIVDDFVQSSVSVCYIALLSTFHTQIRPVTLSLVSWIENSSQDSSAVMLLGLLVSITRPDEDFAEALCKHSATHPNAHRSFLAIVTSATKTDKRINGMLAEFKAMLSPTAYVAS